MLPFVVLGILGFFLYKASTSSSGGSAAPLATKPGGPACLTGDAVKAGWTTAAVQDALAKLGYSPGVIDGLCGKNTKTAIAQFQQARGLSPVGFVDGSTAQALTQALAAKGANPAQVITKGASVKNEVYYDARASSSVDEDGFDAAIVKSNVSVDDDDKLDWFPSTELPTTPKGAYDNGYARGRQRRIGGLMIDQASWLVKGRLTPELRVHFENGHDDGFYFSGYNPPATIKMGDAL